MSKVLIIGNGFDLYHGLPTRYSDFLFLAENWDYFYDCYSNTNSIKKADEQICVRLKNGRMSIETLDDFIEHKYLMNEENIAYLNQHITSNTWIKYFIETKLKGNGWIDFETEIDDVLHAIDYYFSALPDLMLKNNIPSMMVDSRIIKIFKSFLSLTKDQFPNNYLGFVDFKEIEDSILLQHRLYLIDKMKSELDDLIECLALYFSEFILNIKCGYFSKQILNLRDVHLLNFNYTYTYKAVYRNLRDDHHAIHGNCIEKDMVLGIPDDSFVDKLEYIYFKKYFQRIQKRTGSTYKDWFNPIGSEYYEEKEIPDEIYIMGHSLANSDKGVLKDFFINSSIKKITIYYHDQKSYENMIINLVEMFGQDYVIEKTGLGYIVFEKLGEARDIKAMQPLSLY